MDRSPVDFRRSRPGGAILAENVQDCGRPGHHGGGWQVKTAILIAIIVLADSAGDVLLTKAWSRWAEVPTLRRERFWPSPVRACGNNHFFPTLGSLSPTFSGFFPS